MSAAGLQRDEEHRGCPGVEGFHQLPLFGDICPNSTPQHGIINLAVVITGIRADGLCIKAKLVNLRFQSTGMGRAVIYIPRCYENIRDNARLSIPNGIMNEL